MASVVSSSLGDGGSAAQQAYADYFTLKCEGDFIVVGMQPGEVEGTPIRVLCTLVTVSILSSWVGERKIKRLLLFFSHWLSGLVHQVSQMLLASMVSMCLFQSEAEGVIRTLKFLELSASNMLAVTNLGICTNLALVVASHRTMTRVKSVSSPSLIIAFLVISVGAAAAAVPFWEDIAVSGTLYWNLHPANQEEQDWIMISQFFVEFAVGVCMLLIVSLLLIFRSKEIKECWKIHRRIRFYFVLTVVAIAVNLSLGICGTIYVANDRRRQRLVSVTWIFRHVHIALDTVVVYGVLGASSRRMDERSSRRRPSDVTRGSGSAPSSGQHTARRATIAYLGHSNPHRKVHSNSSSSSNQAPMV